MVSGRYLTDQEIVKCSEAILSRCAVYVDCCFDTSGFPFTGMCKSISTWKYLTNVGGQVVERHNFPEVEVRCVAISL